MKYLSISFALALALTASFPDGIAAQVTSSQGGVEDVSIPRLDGAFYRAPKTPGPHPAIILLGGSEGGDSSARQWTTRFLDQGYAVLGIPYYEPDYGQPRRFPRLPSDFASIPVDKVIVARDWLRARKDVNPRAIGLYGASKGAEMALLAASLDGGFAAVAAIVPSDVVWEGWGRGTKEGQSSSFSWRGRPLPFVPYIGMTEEIAKFSQRGATPRLRLPHDRGRHANPARAVAARIAVEKIRAPLLVAGGDADTTWNSGEMAQAIVERRAQAKLQTESLIFTDAGHGLSGTGSAEEEKRYSPADIEAQRLIWPATIAFFKRHLKP